MKRLIDYNLTKDEIRQIFGSQKNFEHNLEWYAKDIESERDNEKFDIAYLLFLRGKREESRKMLESIEDEEYRQECLEDSIAWGAEPGCIVN